MDYEAMTNEKLLDEIHKLGRARAALKVKKLEITAILDRRATEANVAGMSDKQKDNLRQVLSPKGIKSEEAMGIPDKSS